jgi:serine/threonine protein kinase/tetratricopeptide (TPR) repeat protein
MALARFDKLAELFLRASELDGDARAVFVERECGSDADLKAQLRAMLAADTARLGATRASATMTRAANEAMDGVSAGDVIDRYTLLSKIGEGGFGDVWLAERRDPFEQRVALKIIKPGMDSRSVIARFEHERRALALMQHPNIAQVLDGGMTPAGRPYFVMEYVNGAPITVFASRRGLGLRARMGLFLPVCEAVQHAHRKGIIHRDIKPSNVLVQEIDGKPVVKVIDFGIAKAIAHDSLDASLLTERGMLVGTPEYMSPEQAGGEKDIDTRSDVYSLGVLLYELLTGVPPFDPMDLRRRSYDEMRRVIREVDPPRPAARVLGTPATPMLRVLGPSTSPSDEPPSSERTDADERRARALSRELARELEWIPLKALRKERDRRYTSAEALAQDIRSFLDGGALAAGPESSTYRIRKFARQHRVPVSAACVTLAALLGGLSVAMWQTGVARRAEHAALASKAEAERSAEVSREVTHFLKTSFGAVTPEMSRGREVLLRDVLDKAGSSMDRVTAKSPAAALQIHGVLVDTYFKLGDTKDALKHATLAESAAGSLPGVRPVETLAAKATRAMLEVLSGHTDAVVLGPIAGEILALPDDLGHETGQLADLTITLGAFVNDESQSAALLTKAERMLAAAGEPAESLRRASIPFIRANRDPDIQRSLAQLEHAVTTGERFDPTHPDVLEMRGIYRMKMQAAGRVDEALEYSKETERRIRAISKGASPALGAELKERAAILVGSKRDFEGGLSLAREATKVFEECGLICDDARGLSALDLIGRCLTALRRFDEAVTELTMAIDLLKSCPTHSVAAAYYFYFNRGVAYMRLAKIQERHEDPIPPRSPDLERGIADFENAVRWAEQMSEPARSDLIKSARGFIDQANRSK